jgi:hypothetical protein
MNTLAYIIYLVATYLITVHVGLYLYKNGYAFIANLIPDSNMAGNINKLLLLGYYLFNLGYVSIMLHHWAPIANVAQLITTLSNKIGIIIISLAIVHYCNMGILFIINLNQKQTKILKSK